MRCARALGTAILTAVAAAAFAATGHAAVAGRILNADGSPLAGATVQAFERETNEQMGERRLAGRGPTPLVTTTSSPDGSFRLEAKVPFTLVLATAEGRAPQLLLADEGAPMQITLARAALRRGVVTAAGKPVSAAVVIWTSSDGAEMVMRTNADGSFEAPDPKVESGQVSVLHPDFAPHGADAGAESGKESLDQQLEPGVALAGTAVDAGGRPVADARVWLDGTWPVARTDARGAFAIPHAGRGWTSIAVRTPAAVGVLSRTPGPLVVKVKPSRTLSGVVTDLATRRPLAGASVVVSIPSGTVTADTDARGHYTMAGLPAGLYTPYAGRAGYVSGPKGYENAKPIDLRTASVARFDAALSRIPQLQGRVEDEQHRPIEGALVFRSFKDTPNVYGTTGLDSMGMGQGEMVRTAADGTYTLLVQDDQQFAHMGAAAFMMQDRPLAVLKPGFAAAQAAVPKDAAKAAPMVVTLTRGVELPGRITNADGAPLAGVAVTAAEDGSVGGSLFPTHLLLSTMGQGAKGTDASGWTTSDETGRFTLRVHPAAHHLFFRKAGYAPRLVRNHDPRGAEPLSVTLDAAASVKGRVARADGRGVANAQVTLMSSAGMAGTDAVATAADGTFEVSDLAAGVYQLGVQHEDLGMLATRTVEAPASDVQIVLGPAVTLRGQVLDAASRKAVPGFNVSVFVQDGGESFSRQQDAKDPTGAFAVEDVPTGRASVTVTAEGYTQEVQDNLTLEADVEPAALEILLEADTPLRGRITDPAGEAIAEATVSSSRRGQVGATAVANEEGEYELRGLAAGSLVLEFAADGYVGEKRTVDTRQASRLDVTLKRGLSLTGVVVKGGAPVAEAFVGAQSSVQGASYQTAQTDERGRFTLEGLAPGRYTVTANAPGQGTGKLEDVDAATAGALRVTLEKAATAVLSGRVTGLPEGDMGMVMVLAINEETGEHAQSALDASRGFRMNEAPTGRVKVRAMAATIEGMTRTSRNVELMLAPGSETETVLDFDSGITVAGTVVRDGAGVPFVMVSFAGGDGDQASMARTDASGAYQATGLEPGSYTVSVWGERVSFQTEYVVTESAEFDIDITGGALNGRVVRADGGAPVSGVVVSFFRLDGSGNRADVTATSGGQGVFSQRSLREGRYRLVTAMEGFGQEVREVEIPRGGTVETLVELTAADGVSVTVVDARDSRPLEAIVVVRDQARRIVANSHSGSDEQGTLNIPLADGSYLLSTSASGYGTVTLPVTAPTQGLRVGLTPGGTIVIESARELKGKVRLIQPDGEEYVRCWCNGIAEIQLKGRRTSVENVTPGRYTMEIVDSPEGTKPRPVVVHEGQTSTVSID